MLNSSVLQGIQDPAGIDMGGIAKAMDFRQKRLDDLEQKRQEMLAGNAIAEALPNLTGNMKELAKSNPKMFALTANALGFPLNDAERMNQYSSDVGTISRLAMADHNQAIDHVKSLIDSRSAQGQDVSKLQSFYDGVTNPDENVQMSNWKSLGIMNHVLNVPPEKPMTAAEKAKNEIDKAELALKQSDSLWKHDHPEKNGEPKLFGSPITVKDSNGNLFQQVIQEDAHGNPISRQVPIGHNNQISGQLQVVGQYGNTSAEAVNQAGQTSRSTEKGKDEASLIGTTYKSLGSVNSSIYNYKKALESINNGASTGVIASMLPSLKPESVEFDNIKKNLGADILSSGIFGIASERDVKNAFDMAVPDKLDPEHMKAWLQDKIDARERVRDASEKVIDRLNSGATIADLTKEAAAARKQKNDMQPSTTTPSTTTPAMSAKDRAKAAGYL